MRRNWIGARVWGEASVVLLLWSVALMGASPDSDLPLTPALSPTGQDILHRDIECGGEGVKRTHVGQTALAQAAQPARPQSERPQSARPQSERSQSERPQSERSQPGRPQSAAPQPQSGPVPAEETLARFQLHSDCAIELVAAEPDVIDPVHIAFDPAGRLWVVEYSDYPNGPAEGQPGLSRIRILTDDDGDGRYTNARLFADKLLFATGLLPWKDGVIVTTAGSVNFLRDLDGDGRSDESQEWFTGFKAENPQLRANHPTLALDNHIYIASGLRGGEVAPGRDWHAAFGRGADDKPAAVSLSGRDFRFDPLTGDFEAVTGPGQFGLTFDDWGNRFVCDNRHPCKQIVFEEWSLRRNPKFVPTQVAVDVLPSGEDSKLFPISRTWTTSNLHANQFTAACGLHVYRGTRLPEGMYGNVFVCDPTANLVHRAVMQGEGPVFGSHRGEEEREFLATKDEWFRPVNLTTGPDGALYVVDMYRAVIEHPQFMPEELKQRPDLLLGNDRGRIYRIVQAKSPSRRPADSTPSRDPAGERSAAAELARWLDDANAWRRETAHRLLLQNLSDAAAAPLAEVLRTSQRPEAQAHSLWLLHAADALTPELLRAALSSSDPRVQGQAVLVAAERSAPSDEIAAAVKRLTGEAGDPSLQFALALSLPDLLPEAAAPALLSLLRQATAGPWVSQACATAPPATVLEVLRLAVQSENTHGAPPAADVLGPLFEVAGATAEPAELSLLLSTGLPAESISRLSQGLRRRGKRWSDWTSQLSPEAAQAVAAWIASAQATARRADAAAGDRLEALSALAHSRWEEVSGCVEEVLRSRSAPSVRAAAVEVVGQFRTADVGRLLVDGFTSHPPEVRSAVIRTMIATPARLAVLLDEIEAKRIPPQMVEISVVNRITSSGDPALRARAKSLFASLTPEARQKVLRDYQSCLTLDSDPLRGQLVFKANCVTCHRIGELGVNVAPDISDSRTKTREYLLTSILDPNRAIDNNYFSYTVLDADGVIHTGVLSSETATAVTLKQPEGKVATIPREQIEEFKSNGVSLMPEGLEKNINPQQMADLISFIKNWRYLDGSVPKEVIR